MAPGLFLTNSPLSYQKKRAPRKYHAAWQHLKRHKILIIECDQRAAFTIKKAIKKEKCRDEGFKIINEVEKVKLAPIEEQLLEDGMVLITFRLVQKFGLVEITS